MQLLTNTNYSLQYQCYSDTEENSWSGSIDFTVDREYETLLDWFKSERKDIFDNLCKYQTDQDKTPNLEQFWFIMSDVDSMNEYVDSLSEEQIQNIGKDCETKEEFRYAIKAAAISHKPTGFIQWHKHPKRMSEYGRETLQRLTAPEGLYSIIGCTDQVDITKGDYNAFSMQNTVRKQSA
jgi:hypothetical protein